MTHKELAVRVATIDIGTNTVLLLVAEQRQGGSLVALEERATITRLGQGVDKTRALAPEAIARTNACLDDYAAIIRAQNVSRVDVVGTSAMRDAKGGDEVRTHAERVLGVPARVIGGDEEASLTFSGALVGLDATGTSQSTVFDIGGGSTEIVQGDRATGAIRFAKSFDVGSVRMTERHVKSDPPTASELDAVRADVRAIVSELPALATGEDPVGIAGTVTTLAAIALEMDPYDAARIHGARIETRTLEAVVQKLASMPLAARRSVRGLEPKRADVIVSGGLVALSLLERFGASAMRVSDRGVRWGLALALCK